MGKDDNTNHENGGKDNSDQSSAGSVGGGGIAGGIVGGVLLVGVVLAGVAVIVYRRRRQKEQAYDKHQEEGEVAQQGVGRKAIAMIEMTENPVGAAVGLVVVDDFASTNPPPPPPTPVPSLPNRPAAISFGFNQDLASDPTLQAGRDRSSRRKVQKKKRSLPMPTSPVTPTAHGSLFSESQDDEQEKQEMHEEMV